MQVNASDKIENRGVSDRCWLLGALVIWAFVAIAVLWAGERPTDSQYFNYIGRCLNANRRLYVDVWDCKGPILYWVSALGVWLNPQWGFRVLFAAFWLADLLLFWSLTRRLGKNAGLATFLFVLSALGCGQDSFLVIGRQESLGVFAALSALHLDCRSRGRRLFDFAIGICGGVAFMIKPTFAAFGAFLLVRWLMDAVENRNWKAFGSRVGCAVVGGVSVLAVVTVAYLPDRVHELWRGALLWNLCERIGNSPWRHWLVRLFTDRKFLCRFGWTFLLWGSLSMIGLCANLRNRKVAWPWFAWLAAEAVLMFKIPDFLAHYVVVAVVPTICLLVLALPLNVLRGLVLCATFVIMWKALGTIPAHLLEANARRIELDRIGKLGCGQIDHVAVYGGNGVFSCLNQLRVFSDQRYPFLTCWVVRCDKTGTEEMKADFQQALEDPRCEFFICQRNLSIKSIKRKMPITGFDRFSQIYDAKNYMFESIARSRKRGDRDFLRGHMAACSGIAALTAEPNE